jgi:hypothetical protein
MLVRTTELESTGGGTLRPADGTNQYSRVSVWPRPFMREQVMLDRGIMQDQSGPMTTVPPVYWDSPQPPRIPSGDGDLKRARAEQQRVLWPRWEPYNLNEPYPYANTVKRSGLDGLGQTGGQFPAVPLIITLGGIILGFSGYQNDHPPMILLGVVATVAAGSVLINQLQGRS